MQTLEHGLRGRETPPLPTFKGEQREYRNSLQSAHREHSAVSSSPHSQPKDGPQRGGVAFLRYGVILKFRRRRRLNMPKATLRAFLYQHVIIFWLFMLGNGTSCLGVEKAATFFNSY